MNKHATASANISGLTPICAMILHIMLPVAQSFLDEGIALGKPLNEIFIVDIMDGNVQMLIGSKERRVTGQPRVYHGEYVGDFAIGKCLWTSECCEATQ